MSVEINVNEEPTEETLKEPTPDVIVMEVEEPSPSNDRELGEHSAHIDHHAATLADHEARISALEQAALASAVIDEVIASELEAQAEAQEEAVEEVMEAVEELPVDEPPTREHWFYAKNPFKQ